MVEEKERDKPTSTIASVCGIITTSIHRTKWTMRNARGQHVDVWTNGTTVRRIHPRVNTQCQGTGNKCKPCRDNSTHECDSCVAHPRHHIHAQERRTNTPRRWKAHAIGAFVWVWGMQSTAWAAETDQLFALQCAGCHTGGGNIIEANKTLQLRDLEKYGLDSVQQLYDLIYTGAGRMPGYGEGCQGKLQCTFGKRFTNQEVQDMAEYVLQRAQEGWK